jgi:hypothetical protein
MPLMLFVKKKCRKNSCLVLNLRQFLAQVVFLSLKRKKKVFGGKKTFGREHNRPQKPFWRRKSKTDLAGSNVIKRPNVSFAVCLNRLDGELILLRNLGVN